MRAGLAMKVFLLEDPTVSGIVRKDEDPGTYPWGKIPSGKQPPYLAYHRISTTRTHTHSGSVPVRRAVYQLDAFAASRAELMTLSDAVADRLDGYQGAMGDLADCTVKVESDFESVVPPTDGEDQADDRTIMTVRIIYHAA